MLDAFGRKIEYLRLSVTDRCDLRCQYCLPKSFKNFLEPDSWLTFDEIEMVVRVFAALGVSRVRLTGGEPLTRKNVVGLAATISAIKGIDDLSLSTNATRLVHLAEPLKRAGVSRINVSLDSLDAEQYRTLTGGLLHKVLDGIEAAHNAGLSPIKINMVYMQGVNDNEVEAMVDFCIERGLTLRLIETMPMGAPGQQASDHYASLKSVETRLAKKFDAVPGQMSGGGPARYLRLVDSNAYIGFITPKSQHFCATCNRVRLTADGHLYLCLGQNDQIDLATPLRAGVSEQQLEQIIRQAILAKPEKHEFNEKPDQILRFMSLTGG
jgi:GTP 3',8-cyclase